MKKKEKNKKLGSRSLHHMRPLNIIIIISFLVLIGAVVSETLLLMKIKFAMPSSVSNIFWWTVVIAFALLLSVHAIIIAFYQKSIYSSQMRFNYDTFATIRDVFNEHKFLNAINTRYRHSHFNYAIISFSVYQLKREIFSHYGYAVGSKITGIVFQAIENLWLNDRRLIYGYDYNENFLLAIPYVQEGEIRELTDSVTSEVDTRLEQNGLAAKSSFFFGTCFSTDKKTTAAEMLQHSLIAGDFSRINNERPGLKIYEENMFNTMAANVHLADEIIRGLNDREFEVFYQPKYDLNLKRFIGAEALLRWHHPTKGLLTPAAFIPFAEQSDLILQIDHYVFDTVCQDITAWKNKRERLLPISINFSRRTLFQTDLVGFVSSKINEYKVNPMLIEVEIIESPASRDVLYLLSLIKQFKAMKIKVGIDDFGTGYSSLSYIKRLPFDTIKIDKVFLDDIEIDEKSREIVSTVVRLAHILEAYIVVEGVQEYKQVQLMKKIGVDCIQGYYYSRPLSPEQYLTFLKTNRFEKRTKK
ncbi:MAG: EAL domain-containing protein [Bacilli bacterium]|jgi:EAL domain-containing protein (putative c-di-GMP-specific phosphodiesterase class I)|nr:EAL domain-containing protein [Bacilli bacterium]